jgi:hypothetical protein
MSYTYAFASSQLVASRFPSLAAEMAVQNTVALWCKGGATETQVRVEIQQTRCMIH